MNPLSLVNAIFLWIYGIAMLQYTLRNWQNPNKQSVKYSELYMAFLLFYAGYNLTMIFPDPNPDTQFYLILMIFIYSGINVWLYTNLLINFIIVRKNPHLKQEKSYEKFYEHLATMYKTEAEARKADSIKDTSRKLLHFIQFLGIILIHIFCYIDAEHLASIGIEALDLRNYYYFIVAGLFFFVMLTGDLFRMTRFDLLPHWAFMWYTKSLEPEREKWTVNSAVPILLANLLFISAFVPLQIFFVATFISCISDAMASTIGKAYGKHKLTQIGRFPNKSLEGLLGGIGITFIGVFIIFIIYPVGSSPILLGFGCAIVSSIAFGLIDLYNVKMSDNLINNTIPGILVWLLIILFG
jgi:dolichol kinase